MLFSHSQNSSHSCVLHIVICLRCRGWYDIKYKTLCFVNKITHFSYVCVCDRSKRKVFNLVCSVLQIVGLICRTSHLILLGQRKSKSDYNEMNTQRRCLQVSTQCLCRYCCVCACDCVYVHVHTFVIRTLLTQSVSSQPACLFVCFARLLDSIRVIHVLIKHIFK